MQPTNRGNKMRANAKYVREGAMGYIGAEDFYKEVRGFSRSLLSRGGPRAPDNLGLTFAVFSRIED